MDNRKAALAGCGVFAAGTAAFTGLMSARFLRGRRLVDQELEESSYPELEGVGSVKHLSVLPLIDWFTCSENLTGEAGVSYLVRADGFNVLLDVGLNRHGEHPSPLLRNMSVLGVDVDELDAVFITHPHLDHLGGLEHQRNHSFSLSGEEVNLGGIPAYVPCPLRSATAECLISYAPRKIAPGVVTTGVIPRQLFFFGYTPEQSLAVRVEGKGVVLIIGCGHPTLQRIIERAEMLFDEPLYGVIGGLHYPVTDCRNKMLGIPLQMFMGTGKWPWDPVTRGEVDEAISVLKRRDPGIVAISPHDSCDWSLEEFRSAFGDRYREVLVGMEIDVA